MNKSSFLSLSWVVLFGLATAFSAIAAEVDSFTGRRPLLDAAPFLDQVVNVWMEEAVIEANEPSLLDEIAGSPHECNAHRLYSALEDRLAGYLIGQLERFADKSTAIDTIHTPFDHSIYRDFDFSESPTVILTEQLAVLLRLGDVYLGSDKLGHFFTEGHTYYERYLERDADAALEYGKLMESTFYGELTTGIFSYADLAANLNGLRFWNSILALKPDPIDADRPVQPLIGCVKGKWHRLRAFHWRDYVDPAWDEAINCNVYGSDSLLEKATRRIAQVTGGTGCPLHQPDRKRLQNKYGKLLPLVFNDKGPRTVHSFDLLLQEYWQEILR
jgi:hypothetical protein